MSKTLQEVIEESSIETFESSNGRRVAHCPFHEGDRHPSFVLYPNETYFCFGCKVWGNPVKFLVDYKKMPAQQALEYVGIDYRLPRAEKKVIKVKNTLATGRFLLDVAADYHEYLMDAKGPKDYLHSRGLTDKTIKKHMVGYSDGNVLQMEFAEEYAMAEEVGLLNKSGYDTMSHRIVIPNIIDGEFCDFMIGRTVINDKIKYLGLRMPKPIMGFHQYRHSPILFMVEGTIDWLLLTQWGFPAVALNGTHLTKTNISLIKDKLLIIIPDNDDAGFKAAESIQKDVYKSLVLDYKHLGVKDIGELAQKSQGEENFRDVVVGLKLEGFSKWLPL